ncbi:hypothetical protein U0C82_08270 [Fulvimarina sp. 2208YS6-2-32]|uniref:Holin n=1 Tax=Fulvimarina uroteuthidis TaxID=3098149 RepID=A0ABU5I184_9HYPH|nr:hypothetical protein [Fulvimarina sp. 2208YS6-2-32]MDY8109139.1 hypothetical protein [Fulvimarina sp. 2208YS6-2-32]
MIDQKEWYRSRTVWGGLVALGAALGGLWGLEVSAPMQETITTTLLDMAAAIGALVAIYGRLAADKTLK